MSAEQMETIKIGDYVVIQRQNYTKIQKFTSLDTIVQMGKDIKIELRNIENHPYYTTFKLVFKDNPKSKLYVLEPFTAADMKTLRESLNITESGKDNRNIVDDAQSQKLSSEEILQLREKYTSSEEIVSKLVENSTSFANKTEFSQEKYLKKKDRKYCGYVQFKKPTVRSIADIYYRQDQEKVMGIRFDTLSQIVSYGGVQNDGNFLLYESGSNGLLPAAISNSIGAKTDGKLVHMHPGSFCQKQALLALNLEQEQLDRCISVNIYSVLRQFYQNDQEDEKEELMEVDGKKDEKETKNENQEPDIKEENVKRKNEEANGTELLAKVAKIEKWVLENERACNLMKDKFDGLIVAAKEHPMNIVKSLLPFVKASRPIVIFNTSKEILLECFTELRANPGVIYLKVTSNWMRKYQILPDRTHPEVNMYGNSGYLLCGYTVA